jgi:KDO2-lipid IV(A) lauroyltransferase
MSYLIYFLFRLAAWLCTRLPSKITYGAAIFIGDVLFLLSRKVRSNLMHNISNVTGRRDERIVRKIFRHLALNHVDLFTTPKLSRESLEKRLEIDGFEHFLEAYGKGKGVILASIHMGCPDFVGQWLAFQGFQVTIPAEVLEPQALFLFMTKLRSAHGIRLIPVNGPLMELVRALHRGEAIALALDRDATGSGVEVKFFGKPARLPDGAARLAYRTGAPIVMAFCIRKPDNSFKVWVEPPFHVAGEGPKEEVIARAQEKIIATMEKYIKAYPEQWVLSVPLWREGDEDSAGLTL